MSERLTAEEEAAIRQRHEQGERIFGDNHFVHADRRKLLAELDAVRAERDDARHLVRVLVDYADPNETRGAEAAIAQWEAEAATKPATEGG